MDEKQAPPRKTSSSGDKGKKTKKRKKGKPKDAKRSGKSSGTPDGETNSDSAIDAVRRKLSKSEGSSAKTSTKTRKTKEKKSSVHKLNPSIQEIDQNQMNASGTTKPITLRAIHGNLNLTSTTNLIKTSLNPANITMKNQNINLSSKSGILSATNGGITSTNVGLTSSRDIVHETRTSSVVNDLPLHYTSIREVEDSSSSDSDVSEVVVKINESLRWENELSDEDKEKDRIQSYKLNRRKRYLVELIKNRQDKESILQFAREVSVADDNFR